MLIQLEARRTAPNPVPSIESTGTLPIRVAVPADMAEVGWLINGFARRGLMLPKTPEQLNRSFREFLVARGEGGRLLGCVALRVFTPGLAEVSALAVAPEAHGRGLGRRLVETLIDEARSLGLATLFALTLEEGFFHRLGFRTVARELFPEKIAADCAGCDRRTHCREIAVAREIHAALNEGDAVHG
ncbi:MAG: GNAT family N-acetyltransferase [Gemmatimonadetes bacterium]|nr:GNAT family N-acetyltransferase [Gemmatimonadota bacterium]